MPSSLTCIYSTFLLTATRSHYLYNFYNLKVVDLAFVSIYKITDNSESKPVMQGRKITGLWPHSIKGCKNFSFIAAILILKEK